MAARKNTGMTWGNFPKWMMAAGLIFSGFVVNSQAGEGTEVREIARRSEKINFAENLVAQGDEAYIKSNFADALGKFEAALKTLPVGASTQEIHDAIKERIAQSAICLARQKARTGQTQEATSLVGRSLELVPDYKPALKLKEQLTDYERFNLASTGQHVKNIQSVNTSLQRAEAAYGLGLFDEAKESFEQVLRVDKHNTAARRGLERVSARVSDYAQSAKDQMRGEMLAQVEGNWEQPVPDDGPGNFAAQGETGGVSPTAGALVNRQKLDQIRLARVSLDNVTLQEAVDFFRIQAKKNDQSIDEENKGINFVVDLSSVTPEQAKEIREKKFDVSLSNVPLREAVNYAMQIVGCEVREEAFFVRISPIGTSGGLLQMQQFTVPPDFFAGGEPATGADDAAADPFAKATSGSSSGFSVARVDPEGFLKKSGVVFPQGASARYIPSTSSLVVNNTPANLRIVSELVLARSGSSPAQVVIQATFIDVSEDKLEELGFDWILGPVKISSRSFASGGTIGNGSDVSSQMTSWATQGGAITSGIRSGSSAIAENSISSLIASGQERFSSTDRRSPGAISVRSIRQNMDFSVLIRALSQTKGADILVSPSIVARSGEKASIVNAEEFIYPEEYEPPQLPNSTFGDRQSGGISANPVAPAHPTAFTSKDLGVIFDVLPQISVDRTTVDLNLSLTTRDLEGFVDYGSPIRTSVSSVAPLGIAGALAVGTPGGDGLYSVEVTPNHILMPVFPTRRILNQRVSIGDGCTLVLGGLRQSKRIEVEDKVPILGSIPLVGRLFSNKIEKVERRAIVVLVKVKVIDPAGHSFSKPAQATQTMPGIPSM